MSRAYLLLLILLGLLTGCAKAGGFVAPDTGVVPRDAGAVTACTQRSPNMTFFFTENGPGTGDLGGLVGADQRCADAAAAAGSTRGNWVAYLSAFNDATYGRVDARDRIGQGPWYNYCGDSIGTLDSIHGATGIQPQLMRGENGFRLISGDPSIPLFDRAHDIFTGSNESGVLFGGSGPTDPPATCDDWTSSSADVVGFVGHADTDFSAPTWNSAHPTGGCDVASMTVNWAIGRVYCFSTDVVVLPDAGVEADAGDGGVVADTGVAVDSGGSADTGVVLDTGVETDSGVVADSGMVADAGASACAPAANMTFFFTEQGISPLGGNLGGLAGADQICQTAATAAGASAGARTWRAYLSALNDATYGRVDARDRIGNGPWFNYDGASIGDLASIHFENGGQGIAAANLRSECGFLIYPGDPNLDLFFRAHDIFTGSDQSGYLFGGTSPQDPAMTCADWTSNSPNDRAFVGHLDPDVSAPTWNSAHPTGGCDEASLIGNWAIGRIYCFAIN